LQKVAGVTLFCAMYGTLLSLDRQTGGVPQSVAAYLTGFAAALALFFPAFLVVTVTANFAPERIAPRAIVLGLAVAFGLALSYWAISRADGVISNWQGHVGSPLPLAVMAWLGLAIHLLQEREQAADQALHEEMERRINLERQMAEAQLQVLQSQIEPHFLFNSLAHVRRLYQTNPTAGRAMLQHLARYLSATQAAVRESAIALGHDLELAVAYLNIQQIRMGARLAFEIDVPVELREARIPPLVLTTLVENAIKHGLSPLPEGGAVRIGAHLEGRALTINVSDTGQGFQASLGAGVGLANIRARLARLYGSGARLSLSQNTPRGVTAAIVVPAPLANAA